MYVHFRQSVTLPKSRMILLQTKSSGHICNCCSSLGCFSMWFFCRKHALFCPLAAITTCYLLASAAMPCSPGRCGQSSLPGCGLPEPIVSILLQPTQAACLLAVWGISVSHPLGLFCLLSFFWAAFQTLTFEDACVVCSSFYPRWRISWTWEGTHISHPPSCQPRWRAT